MREFLLCFTYARRELRAGLRGFYIFIACLVLGVAAIAAIRSLSAGLVESLHYDGRYILGGDIALSTIYEPAPKAHVDFLKKEMGPVSVVMETRAMARRGDEAQATLTELKAVDIFYPLYGAFTFRDRGGRLQDKGLQDTLMPDREGGVWGAVVEKELLSRLQMEVGDVLRVGEASFQVRGVIVREPDRVGAAHFSLAPRLMISSLAFESTGLSGKGAQVYYDHRVYMPQVKTPQQLKDAQDKIAKALPDARWKGRNFYNASPSIERMIERLGLFLSFIGLTTLLIGGVGISNAVRGYLDTKLANIATLKCLGASARFAFRVYILQIAILSLPAILIGCALGAFAADAAGTLLTAKLSISDRVGYYPQEMAAAASFGILSALLFSFWPVGRAVRVAPTDLFRDLVAPARGRPDANVLVGMVILAQLLALLVVVGSSDSRFAAFFVAGTVLVFLVFLGTAFLLGRILKGIRPPRRPALRMALANLHRPGNVTASIVLSLGLGMTVLVATTLIEHSFSRLLKDDLAVDAPSFFFLDIQPTQKDGFVALMAAEKAARNLQVTPSLRGRITAVNGVPADQALVDRNESWVISSDRGFTYARELPQYSHVTEGTWWQADYQGPPAVSIATDVARAFDIGVGDRLTVNILGVDVTAEVVNVREIDWASFTMNFAVTFAPGALEKFPAGFLATVIVTPEAEERMQTEIARTFPNVTSVRVREALEAAETVIGAIAQAVRLSAGVTLLAGVLVLAGGIAAARRRHVYEAVILKVLGAQRRQILSTFLMEYALLGLVTALLAALLGTAVAFALLDYIMDVKWVFSPYALFAVAGGSLAVTLAAGFAGTWRALRHKPAPWLRNQ